LKRTLEDKLVMATSYPLSYLRKDDYGDYSTSHAAQTQMVYFDNKVFVNVPTAATTYDVWCFYPALLAQIPNMGIFPASTKITGWAPRCWAVHRITGQDRLYYGKHGDEVVYRAWYGYTDEGTSTTNGTAINMDIQTRQENMDNPLSEKLGGEVEIEAESTGNYNIQLLVNLDDAGLTSIGILNLIADHPVLPVDLPFNLENPNLVRGKFHLDSFGEWRNIQIEYKNTEVNSTDDITILGSHFIGYQTRYKKGG
jgi:hypothetical protein